MEILLKESGGKGFAIAREEGKRAGIMTYSMAGTDLIIIDHTEVEEDYKGRGVGKQLLLKVVEIARDRNIKIIPLCPFAASEFKKTAEIRDVLQ